jgi:predicted MFS family arabinose efflux permease
MLGRAAQFGGESESTLPRWLIIVLTTASAVGVANVYFPQALSPLLASAFSTTRPAAAVVSTLAQLGYATGLFLLVPLGDRIARRYLVMMMFGVVAVGLLLAALSPSLLALYCFSAVVGLATVVPQILIPLAADLSAPALSVRSVSTVQAGVLAGILLARAFGGILGQAFGWRSPYEIAGVLAIMLGTVLFFALPPTPPREHPTYGALLMSSVRLFRSLPDLRRSSLYQALLFGSFSAVWTSVALLLASPAFGFKAGAIGIFALVGAASIIAVPFASRMVASRGADFLSLISMVSVAISAPVLAVGGMGGLPGLWALIVGLIILDLGVQCSQVANQSRIFVLADGARSRLNSVYMTSAFLGGAIGSAIGAYAFGAFGWPAVCVVVLAAAFAALTRHLMHRLGRSA